jgi:hypothetical protein
MHVGERYYDRIGFLLGNDSINTFPRKPRSAKIGSLGNGSVDTPKTNRSIEDGFIRGVCPEAM